MKTENNFDRVLRHIFNNDSMLNSVDISIELRLPPEEVLRVLHNLEDKQLIKRVPKGIRYVYKTLLS